MSLRVWLPFTKDLSNQGLSSAVPAFNTNNSSIVANGKLGSCLKTTSTGSISTNCTVDVNTSSVSFGGWFKFNKAEVQSVVETKTYTSVANFATGNLLGTTSYGGVGMIYRTNNLYTDNKVLSTIQVFSTLRTSTVNNSTSATTISFDTWTHLFLVWDRDTLTLSFYVNGVLFNYVTFNTFSDAVVKPIYINYEAVYGGNGPACAIPYYSNDTRIYNHALSAKEVKELSKGLVAHYTLGDRSIQQMNNCYSYPTFNTSSASGGWSHWGGSGHIGTYGQNTNINYIFRAGQPYSHWVANGSGATYNYLVYQSPAFEGGTRSLCCIIKHENGLPITNSICYPDWNARSGGTPNNAWTSIISLDNGFYLCRCENIQQDGSNDLVGIFVTAGNKIYISECYLENDRPCCSDMFYNDTIVYDSSGYNYHGTKTGDLTVSSDTSRYSLSTHFNGTGYSYLTSISPEIVSISLWVKWGSIPSGQSVVFMDYKSRIGFGLMNTGILCGSVSGTYNTFSKSNIVANTWYHFVIVSPNGATNNARKLYINGVEQTATSNTSNWSYGIDQLQIGRRSTTSDGFVGKISDFRAYATALSAEDIKELYQISASIDKDGNLYAYELKEE